MAGGKETPRQKMIGMMYLVLTALLALQVSNAVLEKFILIDNTLHAAGEEKNDRNQKIVSNIQAAVTQGGEKEEDAEALERAAQVRQKTAALLSELDALRTEMVEITGGRDENNNLVGAKDYDKVGAMMIHGGRGEELKTKLNGYANELKKLVVSKHAKLNEATASYDFDALFHPLARDAKDIDIAKNDPNQKMKGFTEYYFENTPTAAGMATISQFENDLLNMENVALEAIAKQVGALEISFDEVTPIVLPQSNIVAAGTEFVGELFLTARSSTTDPEMQINKNYAAEYPEDANEDLEVIDGRGQIKFVATPGSYDEMGNAEKKFMGYINLNDSIFPYEHTYYVARPVIQVQSAALSSLYFNCGNELEINVPALGSFYKPTFSARGGTAIKGTAKPGSVTIIPTSRKVTVGVSSGGNKIGDVEFPVKPIPKPNISITERGRKIDMKTGVKAPGPTSVSVRAVPDATFAEQLPKDARYRIVEWEVILARGSRPVAREVVKGGTQDFPLTQMRSQAKPGDRLVVEVKRVARLNYQNKTEAVTGIENTVFTIPYH